MASCFYSRLATGEYGEPLTAPSHTNCLYIFSWYRAKDKARRIALTNLCMQTDLVEQAASLGDLVADEAAKVKGASLWFYAILCLTTSRTTVFCSTWT